MASSRVMRRSSRNSSPAVRSTRSSVAPESATMQRVDTLDMAAVEAEDLQNRTPLTSFDRGFALGRPRNPDPKTPLDSTPSQRVKLRVKEWKPPGSEGKKSEAESPIVAFGQANGIDVSTPPAQTETRPRRRVSPLPKTITEKTPVPSASRKSVQDLSMSKLESPTRGHARNGSLGSTELRSPIGINGQAVPSSTTREGREVLRSVVEAAVSRSRELGNELLGLALQRLFEESLHNKKLAHLLDVVLAQRPTPEEAAEFQSHVKNARKQIKTENPGLRAAITDSPGVKKPNEDEEDTDNNASPKKRIIHSQLPTPIKRSPSRPKRSSTRNTPSDTLHSTMHPDHQGDGDRPNRSVSERPTRSSTRVRTSGRTQDLSSSQDGPPPAKRTKRSGSMSSTSSLSSTHSYEIEMDLKPVEEMSLASKNRGGLGPRSVAANAANKKNQSSNAAANAKRTADEESLAAERLEKKRKLTKSFPDYKVEDSHMRYQENLAAPRISVPRYRKTQDDLASPLSSTQGDLLIPPPPYAQRNAASQSRAATPSSLGRPKKDASKKMARVKVSPIKYKNGVVAGVSNNSRALREREDKPLPTIKREESPEDSDSSDGDNQDFCSTCGGNGELLCCDGCVRSFHFKCLDPPMDPNRPPEGEWYCHVCQAQRNPKARDKHDLLSKLDAAIFKQNPVAYSLPGHLRDYFEGVSTGKDGEYVEISTLKPKPIRGIGFDDNMINDNLRLKDSKGQWILCFRCGKSSGGKREIISCDFCGLKWHLDCLDPPLTSAPLKDPTNKNRPRYEWMCPAHAEKDLEARGRGGRIRKLRKVKNPTVIEPDHPRTTRNYGNIEIVDDFDSDVEQDMGGVVYKMPATAIILNFIEKTQRAREAYEKSEVETARKLEAERHAHEEVLALRCKAFGNASFPDQCAALALAELARKDPDVKLDGNSVPILIHELKANAPAEIAELVQKAPETNGDSPTVKAKSLSREEELKELLLLEELVRRRRAVLEEAKS